MSFRGTLTPTMAIEMKDKPVYIVDIEDPANNGWGIVTLSKYTILINGQPLTDSQYLFYDEPTQEEILDAITNGDTSS